MLAPSDGGAFITTKDRSKPGYIVSQIIQSIQVGDDGTGVMRPLRMGEIQGSIPCHSTLFLLESSDPLILGEFLKFCAWKKPLLEILRDALAPSP
jgi:hypothetical protein